MKNAPSGFWKLVSKVNKAAAVLVAVLLCGMLGVLLLIANYQTSVAQEEQAKLAEGAIQVRREQIEKTAWDYGAWDLAVEQLVVSPDPAWTDHNIGRPLDENYGFDMTLVVTREGRTSYAMVNGERIDGEVSDRLSGGYAELVADRRTRGGTGSSSGLIFMDGKPALAAIMPIRPFLVDPADDEPRDILVFVDLIDAEMLSEFARIYLLPGLRIADGDEVHGPHVSFPAVDPRQTITLEWDGARPGEDLLAMAVPAWGVVTLAFGVLMFLFVRHTASTARAISDSEWRATHDALTGLPNRLLLFEQMDEASRALVDGGAEFAVAYLDLDGFKAVNDAHGHEAGDLVLQEVTDRLQATLGPEDFAARLGGDEFAVIFPGCLRPHQALEIGRRIIDAIEQPIDLADGRTALVSATVGFTFAPGDGTDPLTLLRNADQALYAGKRGGKRQVKFHVAAAA